MGYHQSDEFSVNYACNVKGTHQIPEQAQGRRIAHLIVALRDENKDVVFEAVRQLGTEGHAAHGAVPALISLTQFPCARVRGAAVAALGRINRDEACCISAIAAALRDSEPEVRRYAIAALGEFDDGKTLPWVVSALRDHDATVREFATDILIRYFNPDMHWL